MEQRNRRDGAPADLEGAVNLVQGQSRLGRGVVRVVLEDIGKHGAQAFESLGLAVTGQRLILHPVEAAKIVEPGDVVDVMMGIEHGVGPANVVSQALEPQLGRGIDEEARRVIADDDARPGPLVSRVGGETDGAVAGDHRHTVGSAGPEDGYVQSELAHRRGLYRPWPHCR